MAVTETTADRKERYRLLVKRADNMLLRYQLSLAQNCIELALLGKAPEPLLMFRDAIEAELYRRKELIDAPDAV